MGRLCDLSPQSADALISCWPGVPHLTALSPLCPQCAQALAGSGHARRTTSAATPSVWAAATHRTTPRPAWPAGTTSTRASACPPARLTPTGSRAGAAWTGTPALTSPARRAGTPKASSSMTASACRSAHRASSAMAPRGQWPSSPRASPPSPPPPAHWCVLPVVPSGDGNLRVVAVLLLVLKFVLKVHCLVLGIK
jgi:hypothetical protein